MSDVSLTDCDREPIHLLGAIQPKGFLLSVSTDWRILRASSNVFSFIGLSPNEIIGLPVNTVLSADLLHDIRGRLQTVAGTGVVERLFGQHVQPGGPLYDVAFQSAAARPCWNSRRRWDRCRPH